MKNNQKGIFSVNLRFFLLISFLTLNFGVSVLPVDAHKIVKSEGRRRPDVRSGLDLKPIFSNVNRLILNGTLKSKNTVKDSVAQFNSSSLKDVLTLLKNVQIEVSSSRKKTVEENQELKRQISELRGKVLDQGNEILRDHMQIKEEIRINHEEMKKKLAELFKDLKSQNSSRLNSKQQSNQQKEKEETKCHEMPKQRSGAKPKETVASQNQAVQTTFDVPISTPTPVPFALTPPEFYFFEHFQGTSFTPSSDEWKTECVDLSSHVSFSSSLKTGGHCLLICPEKKCKSQTGYFDAQCQRVNTNTKEIDSFLDLRLGRVQSFRQC